MLRDIVKKYSDFVAYPIRMPVERREVEKDADGKPKPSGKEQVIQSEDTLNSMKALWIRPKAEVTAEEYKEFYKHLSHDWSDPLETIVARMEGRFEANLLLYIPTHPPFDLFWRRDKAHGVQLYVKRVFIMDDCQELVPEYLRFIRGVVDSESLSLNVSREILQHDRQIKAIRSFLTRKVLDTLKGLLQSDREKYTGFWKEFGAILKQGLIDREETDRKENHLQLVLSASTQSGEGVTTLSEYVGRMKLGQEAIYYLTGVSREAVAQSPHLEAFREKGYEVLFLTDPVDELWPGTDLTFEGHKFQSVGKGEADLPESEKKTEDEKEKGNYGPLLEKLRELLADDVKAVRLSTRLVASPACLVSEGKDFSPQVDEMMRRMGHPVEKKQRILEVNPQHALLQKLREAFDKDPNAASLQDDARLLYGQALLAEGSQLPDGATYGRLIAELMTKALS